MTLCKNFITTDQEKLALVAAKRLNKMRLIFCHTKRQQTHQNNI